MVIDLITFDKRYIVCIQTVPASHNLLSTLSDTVQRNSLPFMEPKLLKKNSQPDPV